MAFFFNRKCIIMYLNRKVKVLLIKWQILTQGVTWNAFMFTGLQNHDLWKPVTLFIALSFAKKKRKLLPIFMRLIGPGNFRALETEKMNELENKVASKTFKRSEEHSYYKANYQIVNISVIITLNSYMPAYVNISVIIIYVYSIKTKHFCLSWTCIWFYFCFFMLFCQLFYYYPYAAFTDMGNLCFLGINHLLCNVTVVWKS